MFTFVLSIGLVGVVIASGFALSHAVDDLVGDGGTAIPRD